MPEIKRGKRTDLSTAGIVFAYAFETTKGTRPTGAYTHIPGITDIPSFSESPEIIDATTLDELFERVGISGLKALPSSTGVTANYTPELDEQWDDVMEQYETAKVEGLKMWVTIVIPTFPKAFFYPMEPSKLDFGGAAVGNVNQTSLYLTKAGEGVREAPPEIVAWSGASNLSTSGLT